MAGVDILATALNGGNASFIAEMYARWVEDPTRGDSSFAELFGAMNDETRAILTDASGASWAPRLRSAEAAEAAEAPKRRATDAPQSRASASPMSGGVDPSASPTITRMSLSVGCGRARFAACGKV